MYPGLVCRGQGVLKGDQFGTIHRYAADVNGETFVVVKFRDREELVSVLDLQPANQEGYTEETYEPDLDEEVLGEVKDEVTFEIEAGLLSSRDAEIEPELTDEESEVNLEPEVEFEEEYAEEMDD